MSDETPKLEVSAQSTWTDCVLGFTNALIVLRDVEFNNCTLTGCRIVQETEGIHALMDIHDKEIERVREVANVKLLEIVKVANIYIDALADDNPMRDHVRERAQSDYLDAIEDLGNG